MQFAYMLGGQRVDVTMTSVLGHVMGIDFGAEYSNWNNTILENLFDADLVESVSSVRPVYQVR